MSKITYNERHDAVINSDISDIKEKGRIYKDGETIDQTYRVNNIRVLHYHDGVLIPVFLSRDFIIDLHKDIVELEEKKFKGTYCPLPF